MTKQSPLTTIISNKIIIGENENLWNNKAPARIAKNATTNATAQIQSQL